MRNTTVAPVAPKSSTGASGALAAGSDRRLRVALLGVLLALCSCGVSVDGDESHRINGAVHVAAGKPAGSAETVNGSITIDTSATVTHAATVNGSIHVGAHATADSVKTVNGTITIDDGARIAGGVETVNGSMVLHDGADVAGSLKNVSGHIELTAAHVAGGIRTVAGDISVLGASKVEGGIVVQKSGGSSILIGDLPRIVIGPGASVQGDLRFERAVHLFVSDKATIGPVTGATAVTYSGDSPPR
jgi:hypothetical protein